MASEARLSYMWKARVTPRFFPTHSLSATIWDRGTRVAHGMVADLSEAGASLVTNRLVSCGSSVKLRLSQQRDRFIDTKACIVWDAQETDLDLVQTVVGARLGIRFLDVSSPQREKIQKLILPPESADSESRSNGKSKGNGFDLLIDPHIEVLFCSERVDTEYELAEIRKRLGPFLEDLLSERFGNS